MERDSVNSIFTIHLKQLISSVCRSSLMILGTMLDDCYCYNFDIYFVCQCLARYTDLIMSQGVREVSFIGILLPGKSCSHF